MNNIHEGDAAAEVARLEAELETLRFSRFDHDDAWRLGSIIRELAIADGQSVAVDIRIGNQRVFCTALAGTNADNDDWIERKIALVRRFGRASYPMALEHRASGSTFPAWLDPTRFAFAGGCVPIRIGPAILATVTVSGLPDADDHALAIAGLREFLGA